MTQLKLLSSTMTVSRLQSLSRLLRASTVTCLHGASHEITSSVHELQKAKDYEVHYG